MPLPANARVEAAQTFVRSVRSAYAFLVQQDGASAEARYSALLVQLKEARERLSWNPAGGRQARFLGAHSAQARSVSSRAMTLAAAHGMPELRELVVKPYVLLYAHGKDEVVLLALKHERELIFQLA